MVTQVSWVSDRKSGWRRNLFWSVIWQKSLFETFCAVTIIQSSFQVQPLHTCNEISFYYNNLWCISPWATRSPMVQQTDYKKFGCTWDFRFGLRVFIRREEFWETRGNSGNRRCLSSYQNGKICEVSSGTGLWPFFTARTDTATAHVWAHGLN